MNRDEIEKNWDRLWFDPSDDDVETFGMHDFVYPIVKDYALPEEIRSELAAALPLIIKYPHQDRQVRESLAGYLTVSPEMIVPVSGANGALDLIAKTFLNSKRLLIPTPAFWQLIEAPKRYGARITTCPLDTTSEEELVRMFSEHDAVVLCSPNNPLGRSLPETTVKRLLDVSAGRLVLVDESYADLTDCSFVPLLGHPDLVLVRGFKVFLIPGARIGYVAAAPQRALKLLQMRMPFDTNVLGEASAISVIKHIALIRAIWRTVLEDRRSMEAGLLTFGGYVEPSETVFACWHHPDITRIGWELMERKIVTQFADQGFVIYGMPQDAMRITTRKPAVQAVLFAALRQICGK